MGSGRPMVTELVIIIVSFFIVLSFPYSQVMEMSQFLVIIYFLPLIRVPKLIKTVNTFFEGTVYLFDKSSNAFSINNRIHCSLIDIRELQIRGDGPNDNDTTDLTILIDNASDICLSKHGLVKEYKNVGRLIARFTGVEFWDKRWHQQELLWGTTQSSDSDISALNNHHGRQPS